MASGATMPIHTDDIWQYFKWICNFFLHTATQLLDKMEICNNARCEHHATVLIMVSWFCVHGVEASRFIYGFPHFSIFWSKPFFIPPLGRFMDSHYLWWKCIVFPEGSIYYHQGIKLGSPWRRWDSLLHDCLLFLQKIHKYVANNLI